MKKIKLAELNSDVQSDADICENTKRNRHPPRRLYDEESSDEEEPQNSFSNTLTRPPAALKKIGKYRFYYHYSRALLIFLLQDTILRLSPYKT